MIGLELALLAAVAGERQEDAACVWLCLHHPQSVMNRNPANNPVAHKIPRRWPEIGTDDTQARRFRETAEQMRELGEEYRAPAWADLGRGPAQLIGHRSRQSNLRVKRNHGAAGDEVRLG